MASIVLKVGVSVYEPITGTECGAQRLERIPVTCDRMGGVFAVLDYIRSLNRGNIDYLVNRNVTDIYDYGSLQSTVDLYGDWMTITKDRFKLVDFTQPMMTLHKKYCSKSQLISERNLEESLICQAVLLLLAAKFLQRFGAASRTDSFSQLFVILPRFLLLLAARSYVKVAIYGRSILHQAPLYRNPKEIVAAAVAGRAAPILINSEQLHLIPFINKELAAKLQPQVIEIGLASCGDFVLKTMEYENAFSFILPGYVRPTQMSRILCFPERHNPMHVAWPRKEPHKELFDRSLTYMRQLGLVVGMFKHTGWHEDTQQHEPKVFQPVHVDLYFGAFVGGFAATTLGASVIELVYWQLDRDGQ